MIILLRLPIPRLWILSRQQHSLALVLLEQPNILSFSYKRGEEELTLATDAFALVSFEWNLSLVHIRLELNSLRIAALA